MGGTPLGGPISATLRVWYTGCLTVSVSTLIAYNSVICWWILKIFQPLNYLWIGIFWHLICHDACIISYFESKNIFDKVLPEMVCVCPPRIPMLLCFELEQIRDHIYYRNGGHLYSKCDLRFALAQSQRILVGHTKTIFGRTLSKMCLDIEEDKMYASWHIRCQKNSNS